MQPTCDEYTHRGSNAWGQDSVTRRQRFVIEEADIGVTKQHYLGMNHKTYKFEHADVGCFIEVITDGTGYYSWAFCESGKPL